MINGNGDHYTPGRCYECKLGEHEDYSDDIKLCKVTDEDGHIKRINLCADHRYSNDFAEVQELP
jgi:hypothetical protein